MIKSRRTEFANTWGDGLFVVFKTVKEGADFALALLERVQEHEWENLGADLTPGIRIALHTGPAYRCYDSIASGNNYFGRHVNLAARIEPATEVNCVYTSEQFAAILALEADHNYYCEYVGLTTLPKDSGELPLYHLMRR